jgi:hypothetical protein
MVSSPGPAALSSAAGIGFVESILDRSRFLANASPIEFLATSRRDFSRDLFADLKQLFQKPTGQQIERQ